MKHSSVLIGGFLSLHRSINWKYYHRCEKIQKLQPCACFSALNLAKVLDWVKAIHQAKLKQNLHCNPSSNHVHGVSSRHSNDSSTSSSSKSQYRSQLSIFCRNVKRKTRKKVRSQSDNRNEINCLHRCGELKKSIYAVYNSELTCIIQLNSGPWQMLKDSAQGNSIQKKISLTKSK